MSNISPSMAMSNSISNLVSSLEAVILGSPVSSPTAVSANPISNKQVENDRQFINQVSSTPVSTNTISMSNTLNSNTIENDLLNAAKETSSCLTNNENLPDSLSRFEFFRCCQEKKLIEKLKLSLEEDPSLANIRQTKGELYHGQTPLHTAAMHANFEALQVLLNSKRVSAWARDLYGRTPLHLVSIHLHLQGSIAKMDIEEVLRCCTLLKEAMILERGIDPVGVNAPVDLAGMSPMGWVNKESKGKASPALKAFLFRPGDASVLPITPTRGRSGQSPLISSTKSSTMASARMKYLAASHAKLKTGVTSTARKGIDSTLFSPSELVDRGVSSLFGPSASTNTNNTSAVDSNASPMKILSNIPSLKSLSSPKAALTNNSTFPSFSSTTDVSQLQSETITHETFEDVAYSLSHTNKIQYGFSTASGWRDSMEDKISVSCPLKLSIPKRVHEIHNTEATTSIEAILTEEIQVGLFCVCDGHGGSLTARYITENVAIVFTSKFGELYALDRNIRDDKNIANNENSPTKSPTTPKTNITKSNSNNNNNDESEQNFNDISFDKYINEDDAIILTDLFWTRVLQAVCETLESQLQQHPKMRIPDKASSFGKKSAKDSSGSTAVITLVTATSIYIANVGDSRAVLSLINNNNNICSNSQQQLQVKPLTKDHKYHKTESPEECARAETCGAKLLQYDHINGYMEVSVPSVSNAAESNVLRMSRSFGDFLFKLVPDVPLNLQPVIAVPEVTVHMRSKNDLFMVMASDGIWDVMSNEETIDFVYKNSILNGFPINTAENVKDRNNMNTEGSIDGLARISDLLLQKALEKGSVDNMCVIIIWLNNNTNMNKSSSLSSTQLSTLVEGDSEYMEPAEKEWFNELSNGTAKKLFINDE